MAVPEQTPYIEHIANGVTTSFALEFECKDKEHLIVLVDNVEPSIGTWSLANGSVVFGTAPADGKIISIQRNTPFRRDEDFQSYDNSFRPPGVNKGFDKIWLKLQELGVADWILSNRIESLKAYVDDRDDELRAYLMEEIRKQGVALDQLDDYYNYLMQRLAQIAVDKGWDASFVVDASGLSQQELNNGVESIAGLPSIPNPKNGSRVYVKAYRSGWAAEAIYRGPKGGGQFAYNSLKSTVNDGVHCFNGWERIDYDKYYVNTDIAGFYGDGTNDDFISFMRVNKYIISLDFWTPKTFEMMGGNFLVSSFTDECILVPEYGLTALCTITGNMTIKGQGKSETKITYGFDYLAWMYNRFTTNYELNAGLISNPLHCTFSPNATYVSQIKGINIESFSVDIKGDVYYYNQEQATKGQEGKAFCSISPISWALNTIQDIKVTDLKTIRNPAMQNIAFNNSREYTDNVIIHGTEHEYCGEASSLLNKCPDHSSIYCNGKYTKITGSKFTSSRSSTINCAIEFHGNGEVSDNEFIDCAAPLYAVNLQGYFDGTFNEYFDNTEITVKNNIVRGAIYGIGYANGGKMTLNIENNNIKLRKEKSNSAWVNGKVYVHGGLDARGLINLSETENSYTKVIGGGNTFEQEEPTDWTTEDRYINSCIATKNIQELLWTDNTFINFKGSAVVLEKPSVSGLLAAKPKIKLSGNTYINCGSVQDASKPHLVTDSIVYISNADILDFSGSNQNTEYGSIHIENETYINCKYERVITQFKYDTLFSKADVNISCKSSFLTPVSFVTSYPNFDSFTDYSFNMKFGLVTPNLVYGMGKVLTGYDFNIEYDYNVPTTSRIYSNKIIKVKSLSSIATTSYAVGTSTIGNGDKPNGLSIYDRDSVYFPQNRPSDVQKLTYNSLNGQWE